MHFGCFYHLILNICCIFTVASALPLPPAPSNSSSSSPKKSDNSVLFSEGGTLSVADKSGDPKPPPLVGLAGSSLPPNKTVDESLVDPSTNDTKISKPQYSDQATTDNKPNSFLSPINDHEGDGNTISVKKDLDHIENLGQFESQVSDSSASNGVDQQKSSEVYSQSNVKVPDPDAESINGFTEAAGVIFVLSLAVIAFIMYRTCKLVFLSSNLLLYFSLSYVLYDLHKLCIFFDSKMINNIELTVMIRR